MEDQGVRAALDLKIGIEQLRRYAKFTNVGAEAFSELEREIETLWASVRELNLSADAPAAIARGDGQIVPFGIGKDGRRMWILDSVLARAEKHDTHRQCDLKSILNVA